MLNTSDPDECWYGTLCVGEIIYFNAGSGVYRLEPDSEELEQVLDRFVDRLILDQGRDRIYVSEQGKLGCYTLPDFELLKEWKTHFEGTSCVLPLDEHTLIVGQLDSGGTCRLLDWRKKRAVKTFHGLPSLTLAQLPGIARLLGMSRHSNAHLQWLELDTGDREELGFLPQKSGAYELFEFMGQPFVTTQAGIDRIDPHNVATRHAWWEGPEVNLYGHAVSGDSLFVGTKEGLFKLDADANATKLNDHDASGLSCSQTRLAWIESWQLDPIRNVWGSRPRYLGLESAG